MKIHLRHGMEGEMEVETRSGASIKYLPSGSYYDGVEEMIARVYGPGEYRIKEWCGDDFYWGEWKEAAMYKVWVQTGTDPKWYTNAMEYDTAKDAEAAGMNLAYSWSALADYKVWPVGTDPNELEG